MRKRLQVLKHLKGRVVLVSNRAPYVLRETQDGLKKERASGGLVSALEPLALTGGGVWIAWGGCSRSSRQGVRIEVAGEDGGYVLREVVLTPEEIEGYYNVFANRVLWPLCHYFLENCSFNSSAWSRFCEVNEKFAEIVCEEALTDDLVWIHDYHLSLVPGLIRKGGVNSRVGFFWHIPFPDADVFRTLPQAREILKGLLGSDLIGFHLQGYCNNFLRSVELILGTPVNYRKGTVEWEGRQVAVRSFPVGVDYDSFSRLAGDPGVQKRSRQLKSLLGVERLALGVDRLDYTKGIRERLLSLELFFEKNPQYHGRFTYVQIAVPTRNEVPEYRILRREIEEITGRINGRFGVPGWSPVVYYYRNVARPELVAYYLAADLLLVTPLRDGLNLVAKEYIAVKKSSGMLVLSPFAGAAEELSEALMANPYDLEETCDAIKSGLEMPVTEKARRMRMLHDHVEDKDVLWWIESNLSELLLETGHYDIYPFRKGLLRSVYRVSDSGQDRKKKKKIIALSGLNLSLKDDLKNEELV